MADAKGFIVNYQFFTRFWHFNRDWTRNYANRWHRVSFVVSCRRQPPPRWFMGQCKVFYDILYFPSLTFTQSLRLYDTQANQQRAKFDHKAAVLGACFSPSPNTIFSGGLDTWLRMCVYNTLTLLWILTALSGGTYKPKNAMFWVAIHGQSQAYCIWLNKVCFLT